MAESRSPYGPFTPSIRRFLQQVAALKPDAESAIVDRYLRQTGNAAYRASERVLGAAIDRSGRQQERDALAGPLLQLMRSKPTDPSPTAELSGEAPETDLRPIAEPALASLLAIMMQDVLTPEQVAMLYDPFEDTIPRATL